jgi:hypothetical protein
VDTLCAALLVQDFTKEERKQLAAKSRTDIPKFGSAARQNVIQEMHARFIELQKSLAAAGPSSSSSPAAAAAVGDVHDVQSPAKVSLDQGSGEQQDGSSKPEQQQEQQQVFSLQQQQQQRCGSPQVSAGGTSELLSHFQNSGSSSAVAASPPASPIQQQQQQQQMPMQFQQQHMMGAPALGPGAVSDLPADRGLTFLIVVLSVAIAAVLLKKVVVAFGDVRHPML